MSDNTLKVSNKRKNPKVDGKKREPKENDSESQNSSPSHSISSSSPSSSPTSSKLEDQPEPSDQDHTHNEELLSTSPRRRAFPINSHYAPPPTASHFVPTLEAENEEDEEDDKKTKPQKITGTSNQNSSSTTTLSTSSSPPASSSSVLDSIGKSPRRPQAPIPSSASAKIIPGTSSTAEDGVLGKVQKPAQVTRHHSSFHTPSTLFSTSNSLTTSNKPKKVLLQVSGKKRNLQVQDIPSAIPAELASSPKRASSPLSISSSSVARSPEEKKRRLSLGSKMKNSVLGLIKKDNASASPTNSSSGLTYRGGIYSIKQVPNNKAEDFYCSGNFVNNNGVDIKFFGVFDGHGGKDCAQFLSENLGPILEKRLKKVDIADVNKVSENLTKAIRDIDKSWSEIQSDLSGATAIIAVHAENHIYTVGVGDSVCMLADNNAENVVQLNHEQKISEESEQERLKKLAAEIGVQVVNGGHDVDWEHPTQYQIFFEKQKNDSWRLQVVIPTKMCTKFNTRSLASIAVSSSIGDPKFGPILAPCPVISHQVLNSRGFLFIGSDGFFDVTKKEDLQKYIHKYFHECKGGNVNDAKITTNSSSSVATDGTSGSDNSAPSTPPKIDFDELDVEQVRNMVKNLAENLPQIAWEKYGPKDYMRDDITLIVVYV